MAITRSQQAKQLLAQGGRIGFKGGADASQFGKSEQKTPNSKNTQQSAVRKSVGKRQKRKNVI